MRRKWRGRVVCLLILSQLWSTQDPKGSEVFLHTVCGLVFPSTLGHWDCPTLVTLVRLT